MSPVDERRIIAGRYEVARPLGAGGAGTLLLVRDLHEGKKSYALKVLRPKRLDPGLASLFKSEFLLLSELTHPHIVGVREFGFLETTGEPYFTMELVAGEDARAYVQESRLAARDYVELAARLLHALAYVHSHGVLHRDVKPANVLIRRADERLHPVLVDFGLAVTAAAARPGEATGTLPYIAPEIIEGGTADPRSDLFGLGMLLYEVATGRRPVEPSKLLRDPYGALNSERIRRTMRDECRGTVPRRFEDFVSRLLAPVPTGRYPSAGAALEALADLFPRLVDAEGVPTGAFLSVEPPMVGREQPFEHLTARLEALREDVLTEPVVTVGGARGAGVTRLLAAFRNRAAARACLVLEGSSLQSVAEEVARNTRLGGGVSAPEGTPPQIVFWLDLMLRRVPRGLSVLVIFHDCHLLPARECAALLEWAGALESREGPIRTALVLSGCNEGDSPGATLLRKAGRAVPDFVRNLPPLEPEHVRDALRTLLDRPRPPAPLVASLHGASRGNPRLFAELLRLLAAERVLETKQGRLVWDEERWQGLELPDEVAEAARRRAKCLPTQARRTLGRLALDEGPFTLAAARLLAGEHLPELLRHGFLVRDRDHVRFSDRLTQKGADALRGAARTRALNQASKALRDVQPIVAVRMLVSAGQLDEARLLGLECLPGLREQSRHSAAHALLERLLGSDRPFEILQPLSEVLTALGRVDDAATIGQEALDRTEGRPQPSFVIALCRVLRVTGRALRALELLERFTGEAKGEDRVESLVMRTAVLDSLGRFEEALAASRTAEEAAGTIFAAEGRLARARANVYRRMDRRKRTLELESRLIQTGIPTVPFGPLHAAYINRAIVNRGEGQVLAAVQDLMASRRLAEEHNFPRGRAISTYNLANALLEAGRARSAQRLFQQGRELAEQTAWPEVASASMAMQAQALTELAKPAEAEALLARVESLPRGGAGSVATEIARARLALLSGKVEECVSILEGQIRDGEPRGARFAEETLQIAEAHALFERFGSAEEAWRAAIPRVLAGRRRADVPRIRVGLAQCAASKGQWYEADRLARRAEEKVHERSPLRARALAVRARAALYQEDPATAAELMEEAVGVVNRLHMMPLRAEVYSAAAGLLEDPKVQRFLGRPTSPAVSELLGAARDIWVSYGNEVMLRKVELHLAELPRFASGGDHDTDSYIKILHVVREMNAEFDRDRLLGIILDRAIELTGAERGFVILLKEGVEVVQIARNIDRETISEPEQKLSTSIVREVVQSGRMVLTDNASLDERFGDKYSIRNLRLRSIAAVPFRSQGRTVGALYMDNRFRANTFTPREERLLELFADQAVAAIDKAELIHELEAEKAENERLLGEMKEKLELASRENRTHRQQRGWGFESIVVKSHRMKEIVGEAKRFANSTIPVLLLGESGTGKEVLARAIHYAGKRSAHPFRGINCGAFSEALLEAELFGHVRGSFTGADRDRAGLFEAADGGTLFLDEIADMSPAMQVRLLRALEVGEVRRLGESDVRSVDVRVIAATNSDLTEARRKGRFREDLYYRLAGVEMRLPPLRERVEDIEPLARSFLDEAAESEAKKGLSFANDAIARLEAYSWPGNVRELRNVVLRAVVGCAGEVIGATDISFDVRGATALPGIDPARADRILSTLADRGIELNRRQQTALTRVLTRGRLQFGEYQELFRVSKSTTARDLEQLVSLELLEKRGKTRAVNYIPGRRLRELAAKGGAP